jgi:hypothetical protein
MDISNDLAGGSLLNYRDLKAAGGVASGRIAGVTRRSFDDGSSKVVVVFESGAAVALNKTNLVALADAFGNETDAWVGKELELTADPSVKHKGKTVGGIVIKVKR